VEPENVVRIRRSKFYEAFRTVNTNLTALNVPVNDTLVEIKPYSQVNTDETYSVDTGRMLRDSRSNPFISGPRDVVRMRRYLNSFIGLNFKAFQQVLQAGNTFGQSQGYNPVSIETQILNYRNATFYNPLERVSRILPSEATTPDSVFQGRLQKSTVINVQSKLQLKYVGGQTSTQGSGSPLLDSLNNLLSSTLRDRINRTNIPIPGFARNLANFTNRALGTNFTAGRSINVGQIGRQLADIAAKAKAAERLLEVGTNTSFTLGVNQTAYDSLYVNNLWPLVKQNDGTIQNFQGEYGTKQQYLERARKSLKALGSSLNNVNSNTKEYDQQGVDYRSSTDYTEIVQSTGTSDYAETNFGIKAASYIKDNMNLMNGGGMDTAELMGRQGPEASDYITFKISSPGVFAGIKFRAFLDDINHSSKGLYEEVRYVGRPEKFVTYKGMNRSMTFSMYLVAFSPEELDTIWARAEILNKLTFPINSANGGFMVPPLTKLTIGNIIVDQPGYVENVDMRLQDIPWDIDRGLPQAIKINLTFNILEEGFLTQQAAHKIFGIRNNNAAPNQRPEDQRRGQQRDDTPAGAQRASAAAATSGEPRPNVTDAQSLRGPGAIGSTVGPTVGPGAPLRRSGGVAQNPVTSRVSPLNLLGSGVGTINYRPGVPGFLRQPQQPLANPGTIGDLFRR
jgi:hypothetical protein